MFEDIITRYGFTGARPEFYTVWKEQAETDFSCWLTREYLQDINTRYTRLAAEPLEALCTAAQQLAEIPEMCRFAGYCRGLLFESGFNEDYLVKLGFPRPKTGQQLLDDFFGLLVHLSGICVVEARYAARGIPLTFMQASYNSVRIWVNSFHTFHGRWGHDREKPRMVYIEHLRIIRIGRLEFETNWFYGKILVLHSHEDGSVVALSEGGIPINSDGYISGTNDRWASDAWYTTFDETEEAYIGHRIADGRVCREVSAFNKDQWVAVARRGQYSLNIHIPKDGRLCNEEVVQSIRKAQNFYRTYFPDRVFRIFECHSWLFDPQFPQMLGDTSGIVRFQKLFYRFPEESSDLGAMVSVFTEAPFSLDTWQPTTTLQRNIIDHYRNGGRMFGAGGFVLPEQNEQNINEKGI